MKLKLGFNARHTFAEASEPNKVCILPFDGYRVSGTFSSLGIPVARLRELAVNSSCKWPLTHMTGLGCIAARGFSHQLPFQPCFELGLSRAVSLSDSLSTAQSLDQPDWRPIMRRD